jgi:pimeloyl-ACP methyl ester carboxylesterase
MSRDTHAPRGRVATLHGQRIAFQHVTGEGTPVVLVHGVASSSHTWVEIPRALGARGHPVLAVDLPGHGGSGKGRGDYSLGALASTLRDLLDHLGYDDAVVVGHSLGGGIALQFAYQFPSRCSGLVLVASGGLGPEAAAPLRLATVPGAELALPVITHPRVLTAAARLGTGLARLGIHSESLSPAGLETLVALQDPESRAAFLATLRGVVDVSGQRVSAVSKLPAAAHLPVLLVWGDRDRIIPLAHGRAAKRALPQSRLVVFPHAGHEPHRADPERFAALVSDFVTASTGVPASDRAERSAHSGRRFEGRTA